MRDGNGPLFSIRKGKANHLLSQISCIITEESFLHRVAKWFSTTRRRKKLQGILKIRGMPSLRFPGNLFLITRTHYITKEEIIWEWTDLLTKIRMLPDSREYRTQTLFFNRIGTKIKEASIEVTLSHKKVWATNLSIFFSSLRLATASRFPLLSQPRKLGPWIFPGALADE